MYEVARTFDIAMTRITLLFARGRRTFNSRKKKLIRTYVGHEI